MFSHYEACDRCRERGKDSRGDNLAVYRDGGGHCFSCGFHRWPAASDRWVKKVDHEIENKVKRILPDDFTWDVPARCWEWLLQYGLPYDHWKPIVGWSEKYQRMVFRIGDPLSFSIGRHLPTTKWGHDDVSPSVSNFQNSKRKWHVWGDSHQSIVANEAGRDSNTLVEDFLSYHKIAITGNQVVCLFGTRIYPMHIQYLRQQKKPINLWLDSDQGDNMPSKAANLSILTGCQVNIINSDKDPKEYSYEEICNYIDVCSN